MFGSVARGLTIGVFSRGIHRIEFLEQFLGAERLVFRPGSKDVHVLDAVVGWGAKETARSAQEFAVRHDLPFWRLEEGFFRSVGSGPTTRPLSLVVDERGIYYDATAPSRIEEWLEAKNGEELLADRVLLERAQSALERTRKAGLSKFNDALVEMPTWVRELGSYVLVVDQTLGDASIEKGLAPVGGFTQALEAALAEHPEATVLVKIHPEVARGRKRGCLDLRGVEHPRVRVLGEHLNPFALLERAEHVYVGTSQLGFEALTLNKPVTCFGMPFYAGWGLTDDRVVCPRRTRRRRLDELVAAAWILYPRYVDPVRGERCELEDVLARLELQRERFQQNAGVVRAYGFSRWKRRFVRPYLAGPSTELTFENRLDARGLPPGTSRVVVWGCRGPRELEAACRAARIPLVRVEDGFLRSVGLGSDLTAPSSLVFDQSGIYFDPRRTSALEELLLTKRFSPKELARARRLREFLREARLSKYNLRAARSLELGDTQGRRVLLVVGQVNDDWSVLLGAAGVADNDALVRVVRAAHPEAFLLYRPHPDVTSKNRRGALGPAARALVDRSIEGSALEDCFTVADEVHTLTSLVGFEALLRGLPVEVYGQPFYAGWGLTRDHAPVVRRTRHLELDELVAGVLLSYPRYYSFEHQLFVEAEDVAFLLERARARRPSLALEGGRGGRLLRKWWSYVQELRRAR